MTAALDIDTAPAKLTEAIVLGLLREKHAQAGNGGSGTHAFLTHVRNAGGFEANRTIDAVAIDLWPSRGFVIDGFEVKVSRSDWQRELAKPEKAEDALKVVDRFTLVAPRGCCHDGELPPDWGLIEVLGDGSTAKPWKLRTVTKAKLLRATPRTRDRAISRTVLVAMLRSAPGAIPGGKLITVDEAAVRDARRQGFAEGVERGVADEQARRRTVLASGDRELGEWRDFQKKLTELGLERFASGPHALAMHVEAIAAAVQGARTMNALKQVRAQLYRSLDELDAAIHAVEPEAEEAASA